MGLFPMNVGGGGTKAISGNIASGTQTVNCGFRPSKIMIDCRYSNGEYGYAYYNGSGTFTMHTSGVGGNHGAHSFTINDNGFTTSIAYNGTFIAIE